jgi:hypothetical protein
MLGYAVGGRIFAGPEGRLSGQPSVNVDGVTPASAWVLVAGASAGIGLDPARVLASLGAAVNGGGWRRVARPLGKYGANARGVGR